MTIVADVKERGYGAVRDWAIELDGLEPVRAVPEPASSRSEAILALADRVRRWHEAAAAARRHARGRAGRRCSSGAGSRSRRSASTSRGTSSRRSSCASCRRRSPASRRIVVCTPPDGAGLVAAAARLLGVDEVWALGGPQAIGYLAYVERVDKIVGPGNRYVNEAKLDVARDVAIDLPGRAVRGRRRRERRFARSIELELAAQASTARTPSAGSSTTLEEAEAIAPEHLVLLGEAEARVGRGAERRRRLRRALRRPSPRATTRPAATTCCPTSGWARSVGGLGLETFLKPVTSSG